MKRRNIGIICCMLGSLLMSLHAPLVRFISVDAFLMALLRPLIGGIALLPFVRLKKLRLDLNVLMMCVFFTLQCLLMILALRHTSAAIAVSMQFTSPIWLYIVEHRKGERITASKLWPLLLLLLGIVLMMCSDGEGVTLVGNLYALATSFTYAGLIYFSKKASNSPPLGLSCLCCLFMAAVMLFFVREPVQKLAAIQPAEWLALAALGLFQTAAAYAVYYYGLRFISAGTAAMVSPVEMIGGPLWVALFFGVYPTALELAAFAAVLAGVIGTALNPAQTTEQTTEQISG